MDSSHVSLVKLTMKETVFEQYRADRDKVRTAGFLAPESSVNVCEFLERSFSAVSKPIFVSIFSFCSIFQSTRVAHFFAPLHVTHDVELVQHRKCLYDDPGIAKVLGVSMESLSKIFKLCDNNDSVTFKSAGPALCSLIYDRLTWNIGDEGYECTELNH